LNLEGKTNKGPYLNLKDDKYRKISLFSNIVREEHDGILQPYAPGPAKQKQGISINLKDPWENKRLETSKHLSAKCFNVFN